MVRQPKFRKSTNLKYRLLSAIILIPLSLYIIYLGPPFNLVLWASVTICLFIEWFFLCLKNRLLLWKKLACILLGSFYLIFSVLWIFQFFSTGEGWKLIFWLLFLVWSTDTAAYVGGIFFKGPKLAPSISPNKTWSGFFAGMLGGTIVSYEASFWLFPGVFNFWGIVLLVLIAQAGDLLESQAKRWSQLKDSSPLIPGHGGFLDRLDSFLAISFALALWQVWY